MARILGYLSKGDTDFASWSAELKDTFKTANGFDSTCTDGQWVAPGGKAAVLYVAKKNTPFTAYGDEKCGLFCVIVGRPLKGRAIATPQQFVESYKEGKIEQFANSLEGGYCAILLDPAACKAMLCQDRFGIKPFFYADGGDTLHFGSNSSVLSKALHGSRIPNKEHVARFAVAHYSKIYGEGETFYQGVRLTEAAYIYSWEGAGVGRERYWWFDPDADFLTDKSESDLAHEYEQLLVSALENRLASQDNFGFSLSGGMDSTSVLAYYNKLTNQKPLAVSVTYKEDARANEYPLIKPTADLLLSEWVNVQPTVDDFIKDFDTVYTRYDHPWPTATLYAQERMFRAAAEKGLSTLVGGSGGDHHQAGDYPNFFYFFADIKAAGEEDLLESEIAKWIEYHSEYPWLKTRETVDQFFSEIIDFSSPGNVKNGPVEMVPSYSLLHPDFKREFKLLDPVPSYKSYLRTFIIQEITRCSFLPALSCEDIMGWEYDVAEVSPYWDKALFEFSWRLPPRMRIQNGINKHLMRKATEGVTPDHIRLRKAKTGFNLPFEVWIDNPALLKEIRALFGSRPFRERGVFDANQCLALLDEHVSGKTRYGMQLWQIINLERWFQGWIDNQ